MEKLLYEHLVNYDPGPNFTRELISQVQASPNIWNRDMDHLRDHLNIDRSSKNDVLNLQENRYYEAAKTLIDILDLTHDTGLVSRLIDTNLYINMNGFTHAALIADIELTSISGHPEHFLKLELFYTNAGQKCKNGAYMVIVNVTDEYDTVSVRSTLGDVNVNDLIGTFQNPEASRFMQTLEDKCYPCGVVLKYNHNFPTPSVFIMNLHREITLAVKNVKDIRKSIAEETVKEKNDNAN